MTSVPQATAEGHCILQKIQGSAVERVYNGRLSGADYVWIVCLKQKKWMSGASGFQSHILIVMLMFQNSVKVLKIFLIC